VRSLELVLLAVVAAGAARALTPWRHATVPALVLAGAALVVAVGHLVIEYPRWQLVPLYVATAGVAAGGLVTGVRHALPRPRWAFVSVNLLLVGLAAALAWVLPVAALPAPDGPELVGTATVAWTEDDRVERYGDHPGGPRELVAQVWYPAAPDPDDTPAPWVEEADRFGVEAARALDLPTFTLGHLGLVRSHAVEDAPTAGAPDGSRPLVVYSHGWRGFRSVHSTLLESLASHGYVVVALDHTHGSLATVFPDGRVTPLDPDALPDDGTSTERDDAGERLVATFAADLTSLLERLDEILPADVAASVDRDRVALLGHSTGGGAAVLACSRTPSCAAVVGFDPWVEPIPDDLVGTGIEVPLLSLRSEEWVGGANDKRLRRLHASTDAPEGRVAMDGVTHRDFTLLPLLSPLAARVGFSGETPGVVTHDIVEDWTLRFLDHHLRDRGPDPLASPPRHDEAWLEERA
jgi:dienelactone hydrolase